MRTLLLTFSCVLAVKAIDFAKIRPIEEFLTLYPEKYPLFSALNEKFSGERIVGGDEAIPGQFPFQAALFIETNKGTFFCGGSILNRDYILTAAHCVDAAESVMVILGAHNVSAQEESQKGFYVPKDNIKYHENWNSKLYRNDIAVLKLDTPITYDDRIGPTVLPRRRDENVTFAQDPCITSGWGKDKDSSSEISPVLRWVKTKVRPNPPCAINYPGFITPSHICATGKNGKSACNGDSGGPLTVEHEGDTKQVGIVSFGIGIGCSLGFPHVYTRVTEYLDWIRDNTNVIIRP